jgi:hypothetical protein
LEKEKKRKKSVEMCIRIDEARCVVRIHPRTAEASGILPHLDELYFTTAEKKILENCRSIVPNFMNDQFILIRSTALSTAPTL